MGRSVSRVLTCSAADAEMGQVVECLKTRQSAGRRFSLIGTIVLMGLFSM